MCAKESSIDELLVFRLFFNELDKIKEGTASVTFTVPISALPVRTVVKGPNRVEVRIDNEEKEPNT